MPSRRAVLISAAMATAGIAFPAWAARGTRPTAPGVEGPFYPLEWPPGPADFSALDDDADLLWVRGGSAYAAGTILHLEGRVLGPAREPLPNLEVHIWQVDAHGRYHHPGDPNSVELDPHFQGFGRSVTDGAGRYAFRTIRPVPYPGRTPHIHFKLRSACAADLLTTQMYVAGERGNAEDAIYQSIPEGQRGTVTVKLRRSGKVTLQGERRKVLRATFDLVLGATPCA